MKWHMICIDFHVYYHMDLWYQQVAQDVNDMFLAHVSGADNLNLWWFAPAQSTDIPHVL